MIRINLLPTKKRRKKAQPIPPYILQGIIITAVVVLAVGFFWFHLSGKISAKRNEIAQKKEKLAELNKKLEEVKNFEADNAAFQRKSEIIEELRRNQKAPLRLLDEISARLPEGVWLTGLDDKSGNVDITGYAFSNTELVTYVQTLKNSEYLTSVALIESRQKKIGDVSIYQFKLTLRVKV